MPSTIQTTTYAHSDWTIQWNSYPEGALSVNIKITNAFYEHLNLRPVTQSEEDLTLFKRLFQNATVMEKYGNRQVKTDEQVSSLLKTWSCRWKQGDPFSAFTISTEKNGSFGVWNLGHGNAGGEAQPAVLLQEKFWGHKVAKDVGYAMLGYAYTTVEEGYTVEGAPLNTILVTASTDNTASNIGLINAGFTSKGQQTVDGVVKEVYTLSMDVLKKRFEGTVQKITP